MDEEVERLSTEHARLSDQLITAEQEERGGSHCSCTTGPYSRCRASRSCSTRSAAAIEADRQEEATRSPRGRAREAARHDPLVA